VSDLMLLVKAVMGKGTLVMSESHGRGGSNEGNVSEEFHYLVFVFVFLIYNFLLKSQFKYRKLIV
jgi:hypothetical protein